MKITILLIAVVFVVLLEFPSGFAAPCKCSCQQELPSRNCDEDDVTFYKRIFPVASCSCENTVTKFYESVFYEYKGESKQCYMERIDNIFVNIYPNLDCRFDVNRKSYLEKYYEYKYIKENGETDEEFFERVLIKTTESECVYKSKVELMKKFVKCVDWSIVKVEEKTCKGFSIISKSTSTGSCGCENTNKKTDKKKKEASKKQKKQEKSGNAEKNCGCQKKAEEIKQKENQHCKNVNDVQKEKEQHNENVRKAEKQKEKHDCDVEKVKAQKAQHCENVEKAEKQKEEHDCNAEKVEAQKVQHCENEKKAEKQKEEHECNVEKVEAQKAQHCENVKQAEKQKQEHDCNVEKVEAQKAQHCENVKKAEKQKEEHDCNVEKVEAQKAQHCENVQKIKEQEETHDENVKKAEAKEKKHEENVIKWIKANYRIKSGEDTNTYYKRICTKTVNTDEEYIERITLVRSLFCDLDLWYSDQYLCETREYYTLVYKKKTTETEEQYFKRLVTIESYESEENCANRIHLLQVLFPTLSLWYDESCYDKYTYTFYQTYYKKGETETYEIYLKRVFININGECEENFWKRIKLVQKTFPDYECWYEKENLKKLEVCKDVCEAENEEELIKKVENGNQRDNSDNCCKAKIECLQTFFKSSKRSESSCVEEEVSYTSQSC